MSGFESSVEAVRPPEPPASLGPAVPPDWWTGAEGVALADAQTWPAEVEPLVWAEHYGDQPVALQGKVGLLSGAGGLGKSALLLDLAAAVAGLKPHGDHPRWCGWRVATGRAVFLGAEDSQRTLLDRLGRLAHVRGADVAALQGRLLLVSLETVAGGTALLDRDLAPTDFARQLEAALRAWAAAGDPVRLVVCDPGSRFLGANAELDAGAATAGVAALARLGAAAGGAAVWAAVHTPKSVRAEAGAGHANDVRGSGALTDGARCVLSLRPALDDVPSAYAVLAHTKFNDGPTQDALLLKRTGTVWQRAGADADRELGHAEADAAAAAYLAGVPRAAEAAERVRQRLGEAATKEALIQLGVLGKGSKPAWQSAAVWRAVAGAEADAALGGRLGVLDAWIAGSLKPSEGAGTGRRTPEGT